MAFVAASSPKVPANRQYPVASRASGDGPDTAQYGLVWPNEWPNGEIHARDDERARGTRDGRDRSYRHGVGGSSKQHERTGVTAGALSGQLAASSPAGLATANDLTIPIYHRPARGRRAPVGGAWALPGSPSLARSSTRVASGTSNVVPATAAVVEAAVSTCTPAPRRRGRGRVRPRRGHDRRLVGMGAVERPLGCHAVEQGGMPATAETRFVRSAG
jgi:hypothetical protein